MNHSFIPPSSSAQLPLCQRNVWEGLLCSLYHFCMHVGLSNGLEEISVGEEFGMVALKTSRNKIQPFYIYSYRNDFYLCFLL